jgi:hypothetical protein
MMKEGGGEIVRIPGVVAVLPRLQILLHDSNKGGVADQSPSDTVERRGETRDCYRQQNTSGTQYAVRFTNRAEPIVGIGQVVEWPEEQHSVSGSVVTGDCAGVPY